MKQRAWMFFLLPLLTLVIALVAFVQPWGSRPASNVYATSTGNSLVGGMKPYGSQNVAGVTNGNLTYHGGPVMAGTAHVFLIFWEPTGSVVTSKYNQLNKRYFQDINTTGLYENNQQYTNASGKYPADVLLGGTFLDTHPYPANPLTDAQVQAEVTHAMSVKGWKASIDHIFFVFTAAGEHNATADLNSFCAYHSFFGTNTIYAAIVYPTVLTGCLAPLPSPNHDQIADSGINFDSHEQMEAATDPILPTGWFHVDTAHEIGDECDFVFGPRNSLGGDVIFHGHPYLVQKEWDNAKSGCVLKGP
jgi:hypothetical protein